MADGRSRLGRWVKGAAHYGLVALFAVFAAFPFPVDADHHLQGDTGSPQSQEQPLSVQRSAHTGAPEGPVFRHPLRKLAVEHGSCGRRRGGHHAAPGRPRGLQPGPALGLVGGTDGHRDLPDLPGAADPFCSSLSRGSLPRWDCRTPCGPWFWCTRASRFPSPPGC